MKASEMTIEEAIRRAEEVAQRKCDECGNQHQQLANWLKELVALRSKLKVAEDGEVAKLKRQVKIASDFYLWVVKNAENELWQTIRDAAIEAEFKMNHPELDGIDINGEGAK